MSKVLADMRMAPAFRRWGGRVGLSVMVAIGIGYFPNQMLDRDPRTVKQHEQLEQLNAEVRDLAASNAALARDIDALRTDVGAIEQRARADLGMVYPDEIVLRVVRDEAVP